MRNLPLTLVVEDNGTASLDILKIRLNAHNYNVITASDGEAGLMQAICYTRQRYVSWQS